MPFSAKPCYDRVQQYLFSVKPYYDRGTAVPFSAKPCYDRVQQYLFRPNRATIGVQQYLFRPNRATIGVQVTFSAEPCYDRDTAVPFFGLRYSRLTGPLSYHTIHYTRYLWNTVHALQCNSYHTYSRTWIVHRIHFSFFSEPIFCKCRTELHTKVRRALRKNLVHSCCTFFFLLLLFILPYHAAPVCRRSLFGGRRSGSAERERERERERDLQERSNISPPPPTLWVANRALCAHRSRHKSSHVA